MRPPPADARPQNDPADRHRLAWVDTAKGICIVLVVMMHSTLGVEAEMGGTGFLHAVVVFAKPFRMPDFFLLSGLFLSRVIDRDWRRFADRRVLHFAYFYLLWLAIQSGLKYGAIADGDPVRFLRHLAASLYDPFSTLWFVYVLAVLSCLTKLLRPVPPAILLAGTAALQMLPLETSSLLVDEVCERWVFFVIGYLGAPAIFALADRAAARRALALAALAAWAVANGVAASVPTGLDLAPTVAELPGLGLLFGIAGALAVTTTAVLLGGTAIGSALRVCGSRSIAIYLAFFLPMAATRTVLIHTGAVSDIGLVSLVVTASGVLVPLALERLVRDTPLSFLFQRPAWLKLTHARPAAQPAETDTVVDGRPVR